MPTEWVKNAHKEYYFLTISDDFKGAESRKNLIEVLNPGLVRINFKDKIFKKTDLLLISYSLNLNYVKYVYNLLRAAQYIFLSFYVSRRTHCIRIRLLFEAVRPSSAVPQIICILSK
jgi:hypothetical protein